MTGAPEENEGMTPERLAEIKARAEAATPGPWELGIHGDAIWGGNGWLADVPGEANAAFVAHAREDVPALVAEIERLRAALAPRP